MDVTFLKTEMFYSSSLSNSPLQGVIDNEEMNWVRFDWPRYNDINTQNHGEYNQGFLETEKETTPNILAEDEREVLPSLVPRDPSPENILEVSSPTSHTILDNHDAGYIIPLRNNRGTPPNRYSPEFEERRSRHPIANYVSIKKLFEPFKTFIQTLSL